MTLTVRDAGGASIIATGKVQQTGQWMLDLPAPLMNGAATATATVTDGLGNTASAEVAFRVDATTEVALAEPPEGALLSTATPALRGTGERVRAWCCGSMARKWAARPSTSRAPSAWW